MALPEKLYPNSNRNKNGVPAEYGIHGTDRKFQVTDAGEGKHLVLITGDDNLKIVGAKKDSGTNLSGEDAAILILDKNSSLLAIVNGKTDGHAVTSSSIQYNDGTTEKLKREVSLVVSDKKIDSSSDLGVDGSLNIKNLMDDINLKIIQHAENLERSKKAADKVPVTGIKDCTVGGHYSDSIPCKITDGKQSKR